MIDRSAFAEILTFGFRTLTVEIACVDGSSMTKKSLNLASIEIESNLAIAYTTVAFFTIHHILVSKKTLAQNMYALKKPFISNTFTV